MDCSPTALLAAARCFRCINGMQWAVRTYLLCQWENKPDSPPREQCSAQTDCVQITGAGIPAVDGLYSKLGLSGYLYQNQAGTYQIFYINGRWWIHETGNYRVLYSIWAHDFPCGQWEVALYGTGPAPTADYTPCLDFIEVQNAGLAGANQVYALQASGSYVGLTQSYHWIQLVTVGPNQEWQLWYTRGVGPIYYFTVGIGTFPGGPWTAGGSPPAPNPVAAVPEPPAYNLIYSVTPNIVVHGAGPFHFKLTGRGFVGTGAVLIGADQGTNLVAAPDGTTLDFDFPHALAAGVPEVHFWINPLMPGVPEGTIWDGLTVT